MLGFRYLAWASVVLASCGYLLPATWRSFRADPDDAAPSITRALASRQLTVAHGETVKHQITTDYVLMSDGVDRSRERYIIRWERNENDGTLIIYVRHEAQDHGSNAGRPVWEGVTHDADKEEELLDAITAELQKLQQPMPSSAP